jgi:hypothetical protein
MRLGRHLGSRRLVSECLHSTDLPTCGVNGNGTRRTAPGSNLVFDCGCNLGPDVVSGLISDVVSDLISDFVSDLVRLPPPQCCCGSGERPPSHKTSSITFRPLNAVPTVNATRLRWQPLEPFRGYRLKRGRVVCPSLLVFTNDSDLSGFVFTTLYTQPTAPFRDSTQLPFLFPGQQHHVQHQKL